MDYVPGRSICEGSASDVWSREPTLITCKEAADGINDGGLLDRISDMY